MSIKKKGNGTTEDHLEKGAMGTLDIVFFVLAGVAPLGVVIAGVALSIALGVGAGVPGTYVVAGLVLSLFAVGYVQMSRRITNVGGFYTYAREGLGKRAGGAAAYLALVAYNAGTIGVLGGLAYFAHVVGQSVLGVDLAWQYWALGFFAVVAVLSYFEVTLSAKVLGLALIAEVLFLLVFDVTILADKGFQGFSFDVFKPSVVFAGGFGISLMFAFASFVGFEATALYGEEARDARRSVPRATYISLAIITVFYVITTWAAISAYGVNGAQAAAAGDPSLFIFAANAKYVGVFATNAMQILVVTSLFASFLAFHANTARYHFALARDGLLPKALSHTHPKHGSPIIASAVQLTLTAAALIVTALTTDNPYLGMSASVFGLATLAIVLLQALASVSIVGFFARHRESESVWAAIVAPALGAVGLVVGLVLMISNYSLLAAGAVHELSYLPWLLPVAAVVGAIVAGRRSARTAADAPIADSDVPVVVAPTEGELLPAGAGAR